MDKEIYLNRLKKAMKNQYNTQYINACLKYAEELLNSNLPVIFDNNHLISILQLKNIKIECYSEFLIFGKNGKIRNITAPSKPLKYRQRWILDNILVKVPISSACEGFVKGHSIVTNARKHIGYSETMMIDIADFFPSITYDRIKQVYESLGYTQEVANFLATLCCYEGVLPQGAPTSPSLANIVCYDMDKKLEILAQSYGLVYTRYADDMAFSGNCDMSLLSDEIIAIVNSFGFTINEKKTRFYKGKQRKIITGIVVKENTLSVPKKVKRKLKQEIYYCQKFGVSKHLDNINSSKVVNFREYLYGKAYYIKMIEPKIGEKFLGELDKIDWS